MQFQSKLCLTAMRPVYFDICDLTNLFFTQVHVCHPLIVATHRPAQPCPMTLTHRGFTLRRHHRLHPAPLLCHHRIQCAPQHRHCHKATSPLHQPRHQSLHGSQPSAPLRSPSTLPQHQEHLQQARAQLTQLTPTAFTHGSLMLHHAQAAPGTLARRRGWQQASSDDEMMFEDDALVQHQLMTKCLSEGFICC
jgi:hypothetical protein